MERRQVTEIPPVRAEVTEHQLIELACGGCGTRTKAAALAGVTAPVQYGPLYRRDAASTCGTASSCPGTGPAGRWRTCSAALPRPARSPRMASKISPARSPRR